MRTFLARNVHHPVRVMAKVGTVPNSCNGLLLDAVIGGYHYDHLWLPARDADLIRSVPEGAQIRAWADVRQYRRRDGTHDFTVCNLREVSVL